MKVTGGELVKVDEGEHGFIEIDVEPTPEQLADIAAQKHRELLASCAAERAVAKENMLARNAKRLEELTAAGDLLPGETLEQYDTRKA